MPGLGSTDGMGSGWARDERWPVATRRQARPTGAAISVRGDPAFYYAAFPELAADGPPDTFVPAAIHNLDRVDAIPVVAGRRVWRCSACCPWRTWWRRRPAASDAISPSCDRSGRAADGSSGRCTGRPPCSRAVCGDRHPARHRGGPSDLHGVRRQHGRGRRSGVADRSPSAAGIAVIVVAPTWPPRSPPGGPGVARAAALLNTE